MINKKQIESILKDYHWMINTIKIMRQSINHVEINITAQYGIEASLPKPQGTTGDPVLSEVIRRNKYWRSVKEYERKVRAIQERFYVIKDEREFEVLHWILEGKSYRWIAMHMGLSHSHIRRIKESVVNQMCSYVPNVPDEPNLSNNKSAC